VKTSDTQEHFLNHSVLSAEVFDQSRCASTKLSRGYQDKPLQPHRPNKTSSELQVALTATQSRAQLPSVSIVIFLTQIAAEIDSSIAANLSTAGSRAPEVTLSMLPAEHEVRQLLVTVPQVVPATLSEAEKK
jgi:hypothetical protein